MELNAALQSMHNIVHLCSSNQSKHDTVQQSHRQAAERANTTLELANNLLPMRILV
jgi:hypothetical protein